MSGEEIRHLANTVDILRDEVLRLSQAVTRLETHTAGRAVRARDAALTMAGALLSMASVLWMLQTLGVLQ
jgi:hypothetical protein